MPSLDHEAPLEVMRKDPAIVPALLREVLGVEVPVFASAEEASADFTQPLPAEFRADLVVYLRGAVRDASPLMGIVIEVQRSRDPAKQWSWPLYVAALHARLERPTCLMVLALDAPTATWAATPITTLQPASVFVPLVLGPSQVPRLGLERAKREPSLAVLSALAHGNGPSGLEVVRVAFEAIDGLPEERATFFLDLITASLELDVRLALEKDMDSVRHKYKSDYFRKDIDKAFDEGLEKGQVLAARKLVLDVARARIGDIDAQLTVRVEACEDLERLEKLVLDLSTAGDPAAVEKLLHDL